MSDILVYTSPGNRLELPILHYHEIMVIYSYPFGWYLPIFILDNTY